jgi:hypothetical protein
MILNLNIKLIANIIVFISFINYSLCGFNDEFHNEYTKEWAVKVSDPLMADLIALETGFENKGLVILEDSRFLKLKFRLINFI